MVPTMGALHQGHLELIRKSVEMNDHTVCSIYVNPVQFNDKQDLINYPRDIDSDIEKLSEHGCDAVFCPADDIMYPHQPVLTIDFGRLEQVMEGRHRPGHFGGVALVVSKLFNMVKPDRAYFGEKDWQQLIIIQQLVNDLSYQLEIVSVPIKREPDGLAMSSRNQRLTSDHRAVAGELFSALSQVKNAIEQHTDLQSARAIGINYLKQHPAVQLEYLEIVQAFTLDAPAADLGTEPLSVCLAAMLGKVRLIDNVQVFID
ncbi:MAG: pantothenate synthetase [Cyclobacteriaceae bacterium]|nr:MAG: pantothenate synthetase [Cyclobacteriaceae bacterium]